MNIASEDIKQQTLKTWVIEYSDTLYTWALNKCSSRETAEDLVQETFLSAISSFASYQNKSHPKTWLFSILNHKIVDHYRKKSNSPQSIDQLTENQATQFTESIFDKGGNWEPAEQKSFWADEKHLLDDDDFNMAMQFCMDNLPVNWRIAITSKYLLEKDAVEICQDLDMTTTNYWQVIHRTKLLLKKCIEKHWKK